MFALLLSVLTSLAQTNSASTLIEAAGTVELSSAAPTNWQVASVGVALKAGDKIRTRARSRAAVQLSDRSIVRLDELTTIEILPPRNAEKKRFGLLRGAVYFFNREKPADVEFDTPLAAGAIRGTEFLLEAGGQNEVHLALIDGLVSLKSATEEINLSRGEDLRLVAGQPARRTALVNATAKIQWALYYPGIVNPAELSFDPPEQVALGAVLKNYRAGDLLAALAGWPAALRPDSGSAKLFRAQLELAVGRVGEAESLLIGAPEHPDSAALRELIAVTRGEAERRPPAGLVDKAAASRAGGRRSAALLAQSWSLQAVADLPNARIAARQAAELAPDFGFAHARLGELEFTFGNRDAALRELKRALELSPRLAAAHALQGFVLLDDGKTSAAQNSFDRAREMDAALGSAWLGRGLCLLRERHFTEARAAFQAAAALEPQRGLFRSYLGKAASELGDAQAAEREFRLAKQLDANDPTAWLYSALRLWQENKLNAAVRDLETSYDKNENRAAFRSRGQLDSDKAVRSANLAVIYDDAGLSDVSRHVAGRAVGEDYANFSGHLLLANSYAAEQSLNRFDLRLETARQSELLVANLLAPPGAGNLSQVLSQSDRLRFFDARPFGASSLTTYRSGGDWSETATAFGALDNFSYAFDTALRQFNRQRVNNRDEQRNFALTMKLRVSPKDDLYLQAGDFHSNAGDISRLYNPASATPGFRVEEKQEPTIYAGWHREWSPGIHTLLLASHLDDRLTLLDPNSDQIFLFQSGGQTIGLESPPVGPPFTNNYSSHFRVASLELQQVFKTARHSLVFGGRSQSGRVDSVDALSRALEGVVTRQSGGGDFSRSSAYGYYTWQALDTLSLIGGVAFDHLEFPENADFAPVSPRETSRESISPKAGILLAPWEHGLLRASYTRSLGGLFSDNSIRLEPTQVGGFNQAFRSLIPESVAGLLPAARFETASVGFDQSMHGKTFFGVEAEWLASDGTRAVGVLTNQFVFRRPDSPSSTRQTLAFQERNVSVYASQLLGDFFSVGARYRLSEAKLIGEFPDIPKGAQNLGRLEQNNRALAHQLSFALNLHLPSGFFTQWESAWHHQENLGYTPSLPSDDFWQHNLMLGYRFARRRAEIRLGLLNLFDTDYRLNPLNLTAELPRGRTFEAMLRVNF
ncbi:MAG: FecR domain-containing protein [Verrucomicrobia bacterium]|nr:FecR domain-containing protein [Verrucomicrobiota bacterium]